jgi:tetratricopeptide (TPR) repeat protein
VINAALLEGNRLAGERDFAGARAAYGKVLDKVEGAKRADLLAGIASTYVQEKQHEEGIRYLDQALAIDPANETALRLMVAVLAAQGRDEEAKQYLAKLPDPALLDASTQLNLGIMRYNEGKLDEAAAIFDGVLARNPERAEAYYFSGLVKLNQEQHAAALERFQKFLELAPQHEKAAEAREFVAHLEQMTAKKP